MSRLNDTGHPQSRVVPGPQQAFQRGFCFAPLRALLSMVSLYNVVCKWSQWFFWFLFAEGIGPFSKERGSDAEPGSTLSVLTTTRNPTVILIKYLRLTLVWTACAPVLISPRGKGNYVQSGPAPMWLNLPPLGNSMCSRFVKLSGLKRAAKQGNPEKILFAILSQPGVPKPLLCWSFPLPWPPVLFSFSLWEMGFMMLLRPRRPSATPYGKSHPVKTEPYVYQLQALGTGLAESTYSPPSFPTMNIHTGDPPLQCKCLAYMEMLGSVEEYLA